MDSRDKNKRIAELELELEREKNNRVDWQQKFWIADQRTAQLELENERLAIVMEQRIAELEKTAQALLKRVGHSAQCWN